MRTQSVVSLDPIDRSRKKEPGVIGRLFITRHFKGKPMKKTDDFGHYLHVGKQRKGKTTSALWLFERLKAKYEKKGFKVILFDNMKLGGVPVTKFNFPDLISKCFYDPKIVYIFIIDEIQAWYPKDTKDPVTLALIDRLTGQFSQLGKRQIYVLSTAQIYGRVHKNLREQCLYMVNCRASAIKHKCLNEYIFGDDVICDDLGRWSGSPQRIYVHGLPTMKFDTHYMIPS